VVSGDRYYAVSFILRPRAGKRLSEFLEQPDDQRFGARLGTNTIAVIRVFRPFGGNEFTYVTKKSRAEVEAALSPIKGKVIWK
jgi:hypothetical protein